MLSNRENFFRVIAGRDFDRIPLFLSLCDQLIERLRTERGVEDYREYYNIPFAYAGPAGSLHPVDYTPYFQGKTVDYIGEWGDGHRYGGTEHFTHYVSCMEKFETPEQVRAFPLPDVLADYRWENTAAEIAALKAQDKIVLGSINIDVFEPAWYLRGMEQMLMDFYDDEEMAFACLDRIGDCKEQVAVRLARAGVDVVIFGDDVGTQNGMMISPAMWRKYLQPRLKRMIRMTKEANPQVLCYYHSDGDIRAILPVLLDCGMDILNPIQPECMNPAEIYRAYHDRVVLGDDRHPDDHALWHAGRCADKSTGNAGTGKKRRAPDPGAHPSSGTGGSSGKSGCSDGNRAELLLPLKSGGKPLRFSEIQPVLSRKQRTPWGSCRFLSETVWKNTAPTYRPACRQSR